MSREQEEKERRNQIASEIEMFVPCPYSKEIISGVPDEDKESESFPFPVFTGPSIKHPKVSVVMPVYNALPYLTEALDSILGQTLEEIEIIAVDDGSTDDSLAVLNEYALHDARMHVVSKPNGGYGHTMNLGFSLAKGDYIGILEPDDFVEPDFYENLCLWAEKYDADIVKSNYFEYTTATGYNRFEDVLNGLEFRKPMNAWDNELILLRRPCIWSAIYKRSLIEEAGIKFNETPGASYQDTAFAFQAFVCARSIVFLHEAYLHYRIDNEASSVNSGGKVFAVCDEFKLIEAFLNTDARRRARFMGVLNALKLDTYTWNLERISNEGLRARFAAALAAELEKANYDGFLLPEYYDDWRWQRIQDMLP